MLQKQPPRRFFKLYICSFFPGATFFQFSKRVYLFVKQTYFFSGGSICSSNRHVFSRRVYITCSTNRHIHIFQEGLSNKPYYLIEQIYTNFLNTNYFPGEPFASNRLAFSRKIPLVEQIFQQRSLWLLSMDGW